MIICRIRYLLTDYSHIVKELNESRIVNWSISGKVLSSEMVLRYEFEVLS
jgi:hypothetical protein